MTVGIVAFGLLWREVSHMKQTELQWRIQHERTIEGRDASQCMAIRRMQEALDIKGLITCGSGAGDR